MKLKLKKSIVTPMYEMSAGEVIDSDALKEQIGYGIMDIPPDARKEWFEIQNVSVEKIHPVNDTSMLPTFLVKLYKPVLDEEEIYNVLNELALSKLFSIIKTL